MDWDVGNRPYSFLVASLAHAVPTRHDFWTRLRLCHCLYGVPADHARSSNSEEAAGDIIEAVAALFDPDAIGSVAMQGSLGLSAMAAAIINTNIHRAALLEVGP